ncbi:MAG TPA: DEAD/DEAH box helicase [Gemmatimonadales bacterium]
MREPLSWWLQLGERVGPSVVAATIRATASGPMDRDWDPPPWLLPHQRPAACRLSARLAVFRGALLADATGMGKTYVALAVASRFRRPAAVVPAALLSQWRKAAASVRVDITVFTHESLSRNGPPPAGDFILVDEAHRFRNPATRRYDRLARAIGDTPVLLLTATPLVNRAADVGALLRLFLPDHGLALLGVSSIEAAVAARSHEGLAHGLSAVTVARSAAAAGLAALIPAAHDGPLYTDATLDTSRWTRVAEGIAELTFPTLGDPTATELMRMHLLTRLASSAPALETTLRRHRRYLEHALAAAARGEPVSRRALIHLLAPYDDAQRELDLYRAAEARLDLDPSHLDAERRRVTNLLDEVRSAPAWDPKAERLHQLLRERDRSEHGAKSIVFTAAIATALHLAGRLGWRRLVVATGRGARIATGALGLPEALALFAPVSQGVAPPGPAHVADVLIATDLASEGLNLQDANLVVHYDLPWSPVRLAQRLGRIARLGSAHDRVDVWWFTPPPPVADRLATAPRISLKARSQLATGAPDSSAVGRARLEGGLFDWRDAFALAPAPLRSPAHAVVTGPRAAIFALEWRLMGKGTIPELLVLEGAPPRVVLGECRIRELVHLMTAAPVAAGEPAAGFHRACLTAVRARLAATQRGPADAETGRLMRCIVRRARDVARDRRQVQLGLLDHALDSLTTGLPAGGLRELADWLAAGAPPAGPPNLSRAPDAAPPASVALMAALFGDGSGSQMP